MILKKAKQKKNRGEKIMIRIENVMLVYDSITGLAIEPNYIGIEKDDLVAYIKENPMPKDAKYSQDDFIYDMINSSGFYSLPTGVNEKTVEYVADALNDFI